jgi:hypothetical protein
MFLGASLSPCVIKFISLQGQLDGAVSNRSESSRFRRLGTSIGSGLLESHPEGTGQAGQ